MTPQTSLFWFGKEESNEEEEEGDGMGQGRTKPIPLAKPLLLKLAQGITIIVRWSVRREGKYEIRRG